MSSLQKALVVLFLSAVAAAAAVSAEVQLQLQRQHQHQHHQLEEHLYYQEEEERELQQTTMSLLDEPSRCISLEELIASDSRFVAETNGAVDSQCLAYNGCTMSRTSCCRVNLNLAWLVCDPNNRYVA